jgi:NAD-dependent SIR2 family protein deacetylase
MDLVRKFLLFSIVPNLVRDVNSDLRLIKAMGCTSECSRCTPRYNERYLARIVYQNNDPMMIVKCAICGQDLDEFVIVFTTKHPTLKNKNV